MILSNRWHRIRYGLYAPIYDIAAQPFEQGRRRAIERVDLESDDRILLLGAGTGLDLEYLPAEVAVTAIDLTPAMVRRIQSRADSMNIKVDAQIGDAQSIPFPNETFDAVLLHLILSVVPDPDAVITEAARVLRPDGSISIYDKFIHGSSPSIWRRGINPIARCLFADLTRSLDSLVAETTLELTTKDSFLVGIYTVTIAQRSEGERG